MRGSGFVLGCLLLAVAPAWAGDAAVRLVDLDLADPADAKALVCERVNWTADGLFLPAAAIPRVPREFPIHVDRIATPQAPYIADLRLPEGSGRVVTVTLVACLASTGGDQGNLFSLGRRSRWLSGHVDAIGRVVAGLDNRWVLLPADGVPRVDDRRWHAISIGVDGSRWVRIAVDGSVAEPRWARDPNNFPPRELPDDQAVLSFADPGSARHLHGLVRRIVIHRGLLTAVELGDLHRRLAPAALAVPTTGPFADAKAPGPPPDVDAPAAPAPGAIDF